MQYIVSLKADIPERRISMSPSLLGFLKNALEVSFSTGGNYHHRTYNPQITFIESKK